MHSIVTSCLGCEGRCCTAYIVPITGYDVWRIVEAQRLAPVLFVQREPESHPTDTGFLLRANGQTYGLVLQHHEVRRNERPCVFLLHLRDGHQRCGIYAERPRTCRTYPMHWQHGNATPRDDLLCPRGSWSGLAEQQEPWRDQLQRQDQEWQEYAQIVQEWNTLVRAQPADQNYVLEQYLEYLVNVYDHRMRAV